AFSIVLKQHSFTAGDFVQGHVVLHTTDAINIRGLRIVCKGSVRTRFSIQETRNHNRSSHSHSGSSDNSGNGHSHSHTHTHTHTHSTTESRTLTSKKSIFLTESTLWGNPDKGFFVAGSDLLPGQYAFPFSFQLPADAPSSYESDHGRIRYKLRAYLDRPWKSDWVTHTRFHVAGQLDPLVSTSFANTRTAEASKQVCCWIWNQGSLHARLDVDPTVIDPSAGVGMGIPWPPLRTNVFIDNWSSRKVKAIKVALVRTDTFKAEGHTKCTTVTLAQQTLGGELAPKTTGHQFSTVLLDSPGPVANVPSILNADILKVEYAVHLSMGVSWACPLKVNLPVLVCPSRLAVVGVPRSMMSYHDVVGAGAASSSAHPPPAPSGVLIDVPPPAYEDALHNASSSSAHPPPPPPTGAGDSSTQPLLGGGKRG
ncbi:or S-antigen, N-terminal domain-domain-containing protein, partial [Catenaria anguillulae PL171]